MAIHITSFPLGGVNFQSGFGIPNHLSTKGSIYVDLYTAIEYINKDGFNTWVEFLDYSNASNLFLSLSGGTVSGPTIFTGGLTANTISATTYYNLPEQLLINNSSTGMIAFDGLSFSPSATTYNIGAIKAWFIDNTSNPVTPSKYYVEFSATTGNTLINLSGQNVTYIAIDSGGTITQQNSQFSTSQQRTLINLGVIVHSNRIFISAINNQPVVALSPLNQLSDLMESIGVFNISGNTILPNGNNLNINKTFGHIFKQGANFVNDNKDPHTVFLPQLTAPSNIRYRLQNGDETLNTAFVDPNNYDVSGVTTPVPITKYTIQRVYLFQSNLIRIQYGQKIYDSLDDANRGIIHDLNEFVVEDNLKENGLLRGIILVKQGTTNLSDTSVARFLEVSRFGTLIESNLSTGLFRGEILNNSGTGLINGGYITTASTTTVNISAGTGRIVNNTTNPDLPRLTQVSWSAQTNYPITNLTGQSGTVLYVTSGGTIVQQNITSFPSGTDSRDKIYLGGIGHPTGVVSAIFNNPLSIINPLNQLNDLSSSIGPFSINGNQLSKITGTLTLYKTPGKSYFSNANYQIDNTNPSVFNVSSFSAGTLSYVKQNSFLGFVSSSIDTTQYDLNGTLTVLGNGRFVAHRIWHQPSSNILFFQYGQNEYLTLPDARNRFFTENFVTPVPLEFGAYLIAIILVRKGETNLDDPTRSEIIPQGKFAGSGSGSAGSVDTLQSAYDNSVTPEILTDSTRGAVTIKNGAGLDTLNVIEVFNSGGTSTFTIKGNGSIQSNTLTGITTQMVVANSGGTLSTQAISDTYTTGGTFTGSIMTFTNNSGGTFTVTGITSGSGTNTYVTGGTHVISTGISTFTNNTGGTFTVTGYFSPSNDVKVTGGTYTSGTAVFTNSTGGTFNVTGFSTATTFTGGVVSGLTATTISATTYQGLPTDIRVTGGTYSSGTAVFTNNTGGTFNVTGFKTSDLVVTGGTHAGGTTTFTNNTGGTFTVTGYSTGDTYVTGGTHAINTGISTFTNNTGGTFTTTGYFTPSMDVRVTGGTHAGGTTTFTNSTGGTFNVTGYSTGGSSFTGGTVSGATNFINGLSANTISATTYYNLPTYFASTFTGLTSLDFGFTDGLEGDYVSTAITNSNILTTSQVLINILPSTDHNESEDSLLDGLNFRISDIVNGVGFNINCYASNGTWGIYNLSYKIIN
jgi:hypothetical protein